MVSFGYPLWLVLLGLIPLIRWLHRFREQPVTVPTSTLFLWRSIQVPANLAEKSDQPDPRWILRAVISSLLILCLAQPFIAHKNDYPAEVWLDDSLSMFTREGSNLRITMAVQQLYDYLVEAQFSQVRIHSLADPHSLLVLDPNKKSAWLNQLNEWTARARGEPSPPPRATLSPGSRHILLSDGADAELNRWAESAPLEKVIRVGFYSENLALTRLSLRRPIIEADSISVLAGIHNLGDTPRSAILTLHNQGRVIKTSEIDIPAHGKTEAIFTLAAGKLSRLQARIESKQDALLLDNTLTIDMNRTDSTPGYEKRGACGPYIQALLDSQADFVKVDKNPDILIDCTQELDKVSLPTLKLHPVAVGSKKYTEQKAHRHNGISVNTLQFPAGLPYSDDAPPLSSDVIPLLSADGRLLVQEQVTFAPVIDSYLDTRAPLFARQPEFPLLLLDLINRLGRQKPESSPQTAHRKPVASSIKPLPIHASAISTDVQHRPVSSASFTPALLIVCLLLIILDGLIAAGLVSRIRNRQG